MLSKDQLGPFKAALSQASRTLDQNDPSLPGRFVELRPGIVAALETSVNHLLTGRRGVGKSTTLAVLQQHARQTGIKVIFVDVETHKRRSYPDVLIEIMLDILDEVSIPRAWWGERRRFMGDVRALTWVLRTLRDAAPEVTISTNAISERDRAAGVRLEGTAAKKFMRLSATARKRRSSVTQRSTTSATIRRKEDFLRDLAPKMSNVLETAAKLQGSRSLLVVLDDFYFVERDTQPLVLDHLHAITKRSDVWLKIGSVKSRTRPFADGNPPAGMQPPHDLQHLSLDVGLSDFYSAKSFLERVASGVLKPLQIELRDVVTETGRERAVLIAGGAVARDYFELLIAAADVAWEETQKQPPRKNDGGIKIDAEHIQAAASRRLDRKREDLRSDAGRDAARLESRLNNITEFARDRKTYFFLIEQDVLDSDWGKEIIELEDLRFVHRIMTTRPNTGGWRGVDTVVFMVDIPALVTKRMRQAPISFWDAAERDKVRRAQWIYRPDWARSSPNGGPSQGGSSAQTVPAADQDELPFE